MNTMVCGSICAGIGGFDLAFSREGFETLWYSEIDSQCQKLLSAKYPNAKSYGDLTQFKPTDSDRVAVVFGGTPCQDLSVAGQRAGLDGKRSGLFFQMVRVCKRLRPRIVLWENVPGALSSNRGHDFASVIRAFTGLKVEVPADGWGNAGFCRTPYPACRWHVAWRVLDAQYFGLAQRRERLFLVASLGDASCVEILFEPESVRGDSPPSREAGKNIAGTISARTEGGGGLGTDFECGGGLSKALKSAGNCKHRADSETYIATVTPPIAGVSNGGGLMDRGEQPMTPKALLSSARQTNPGSGGRTHSRSIAVAASVRRLTPTECERLQGFPDGWTEGFSDACRYRMIGNSVAVPCVQWIARRISLALRSPIIQQPSTQ